MDVSREIVLPVDRDTAWEAVTDLERWLTADGSARARARAPRAS